MCKKLRKLFRGKNVKLVDNDYTTMAEIILEGLGGKQNLTAMDYCMTRLRLEIKNPMLLDEQKIKSCGVAGIIRPGKSSVQVVIGPKAQFVYDEFEKLAQ